MVTAAEVSEYDTEELERQLSDTRRELFNLRFQLATGQLDNFSRINHVRKDVARMMTELKIRNQISIISQCGTQPGSKCDCQFDTLSATPAHAL